MGRKRAKVGTPDSEMPVVDSTTEPRPRTSKILPSDSDPTPSHISEENGIEELEDAYQVNRPYTISVVIAGTIIDNAATPHLRTYLCGQIGRAMGIFNVDEVIVLNDKHPHPSSGSTLLTKILGYMECPQYLRKHLFPLQDDLANVGILPPTALPHHYGINDRVEYRDGIVVRHGKCDWVDVGLGTTKNVHVDMRLEDGLRVTVKLDNPHQATSSSAPLTGKIVSPSEPKEKLGQYWGYSVRSAQTFNEIQSGCPYDEPYDMIIGTSDKGKSINEIQTLSNGKFKHLLLLFGGVDGLENVSSFDYDDEDEYLGYFNHYINVRPTQGTRTIRAEEAIPITLTALNPIIKSTVAPWRGGQRRLR